MMERDSMVFYKSFHESFKRLPAEDYKKTMMAVLEYAFYGIECETDGLEKSFFDLVKPQIDANNQRYENGKKGGRPKKSETEEKPNNNQTETKQKPKVKKKKPNVNVNENVNVNVNDNIKPKGLNANATGKPNLNDFLLFTAENHLEINHIDFYAYYDKRKWMEGRKKINWQEKALAWHQEQKKKITNFQNFKERDYQMNDLERALLK